MNKQNLVGFSVTFGDNSGNKQVTLTQGQTAVLTDWNNNQRGRFIKNIHLQNGTVKIKECGYYTIMISLTVDVTATWGATYPITDAPALVLYLNGAIVQSAFGATAVSTGNNYGPMVLNINTLLKLNKGDKLSLSLFANLTNEVPATVILKQNDTNNYNSWSLVKIK